MNTFKVAVTGAAVALACASAASGGPARRFSLDVVVDGAVRPQYAARGTVYVEAVRDRPYLLRLTNPLPVRVAVALAVDGLNTIDAQHGDAKSAAKWVLGPYETLEVPGWQVSGRDARRFFFTGETSSYGARLGKTDNLGVIEAVFFRERVRCFRAAPAPIQPQADELRGGSPAPAPDESVAGGRADGAPSAEPRGSQSGGLERREKAVRDEYAATGIGERTRHDVEWVDFDLEEDPTVVVRIRYEFREQLVRLGVLPPASDPLTRREAARGFDGRYCPDPPGGR